MSSNNPTICSFLRLFQISICFLHYFSFFYCQGIYLFFYIVKITIIFLQKEIRVEKEVFCILWFTLQVLSTARAGQNKASSLEPSPMCVAEAHLFDLSSAASMDVISRKLDRKQNRPDLKQALWCTMWVSAVAVWPSMLQ